MVFAKDGPLSNMKDKEMKDARVRDKLGL